jgi:hypothetical protein
MTCRNRASMPSRWTRTDPTSLSQINFCSTEWLTLLSTTKPATEVSLKTWQRTAKWVMLTLSLPIPRRRLTSQWPPPPRPSTRACRKSWTSLTSALWSQAYLTATWTTWINQVITWCSTSNPRPITTSDRLGKVWNYTRGRIKLTKESQILLKMASRILWLP